MAFIKVTLANDDQPVIIAREHIVAFYKLPNQPTSENCTIKTNGGHELLVKDTFEELSKKLGVENNWFVV